jgi:hypothetical protein
MTDASNAKNKERVKPNANTLYLYPKKTVQKRIKSSKKVNIKNVKSDQDRMHKQKQRSSL